MVTPSLATGTGSFNTGNYTITYNVYNGTVAAKALTVTASAQSKTYGAALSLGTTLFTTSGLVNGDSVSSVTLNSTGAAASATVVSPGPTYDIVPTLATGSGLSNYTINYVNGTLTVNPAALSVTATGPSKTYGTALTAGTSVTNFTYSGTVNSETITGVTLTPDAAGLSASTSAGSAYVVTPSLATGTGSFNTGNYTITYNVYNGTVAAKALTVTASAQSKTYGAALSLGTTLFTTSGLVNGDSVSSVTLNSTGAAASATVVSPGPTYDIVPSVATGSGLSNYTINYVNGTLTVNPAALSVTATGPSKTYGTALTAGTSVTNFTYSGTVNSETITGVTLTPDAAGLSATTSAGSAYVVTPSLATGTGSFNTGNYTITYNVYNGTVAAKALTVTASAQSKTYGAALSLGTTLFTTSGLVNGDSVTSVTL